MRPAERESSIFLLWISKCWIRMDRGCSAPERAASASLHARQLENKVAVTWVSFYCDTISSLLRDTAQYHHRLHVSRLRADDASNLDHVSSAKEILDVLQVAFLTADNEVVAVVSRTQILSFL